MPQGVDRLEGGTDDRKGSRPARLSGVGGCTVQPLDDKGGRHTERDNTMAAAAQLVGALETQYTRERDTDEESLVRTIPGTPTSTSRSKDGDKKGRKSDAKSKEEEEWTAIIGTTELVRDGKICLIPVGCCAVFPRWRPLPLANLTVDAFSGS